MKLTSTGITDGVIQDKFGRRGTQVNENGIPTCSLPVKIEDFPVETKTFALVLEDKDSYPVTGGFVWIHWLAANLTRNELFENESQTASDFIQGANSWMSIQGGKQSRELCSFYGGMRPPNGPHLYELHVYALDAVLELENGFYLNELYHAMAGHILAEEVLGGVYTP